MNSCPWMLGARDLASWSKISYGRRGKAQPVRQTVANKNEEQFFTSAFQHKKRYYSYHRATPKEYSNIILLNNAYQCSSEALDHPASIRSSKPHESKVLSFPHYKAKS